MLILLFVFPPRLLPQCWPGICPAELGTLAQVSGVSRAGRGREPRPPQDCPRLAKFPILPITLSKQQMKRTTEGIRGLASPAFGRCFVSFTEGSLAQRPVGLSRGRGGATQDARRPRPCSLAPPTPPTPGCLLRPRNILNLALVAALTLLHFLPGEGEQALSLGLGAWGLNSRGGGRRPIQQRSFPGTC